MLALFIMSITFFFMERAISTSNGLMFLVAFFVYNFGFCALIDGLLRKERERVDKLEENSLVVK